MYVIHYLDNCFDPTTFPNAKWPYDKVTVFKTLNDALENIKITALSMAEKINVGAIIQVRKDRQLYRSLRKGYLAAAALNNFKEMKVGAVDLNSPAILKLLRLPLTVMDHNSKKKIAAIMIHDLNILE